MAGGWEASNLWILLLRPNRVHTKRFVRCKSGGDAKRMAYAQGFGEPDRFSIATTSDRQLAALPKIHQL